MKLILMLGVLSAIVLLSIGLHISSPVMSHADCVSSTLYDIDGDKQDETIEIILVEGERYVDKELWCGMGDKWEGQFVIQVRKGANILSWYSLNDLMECEKLFFRAPEFHLVLADYNQDGQIDFNLGQYAACNWWTYLIFTVKPNGRILRLEGYDGLMSAFENSTDQILIHDGHIGFEYYTQDIPEYATKWYSWNGKRFVLSFTTYVDSSTGWRTVHFENPS
ncbi:MAG: hypothetical protein GWP10_14305 [Nitrospiraceae bacterium]|nr:hypothetical protein [Nitrospiraceae bacterium]